MKLSNFKLGNLPTIDFLLAIISFKACIAFTLIVFTALAILIV